jgi:hypothetical protein
MTLSLFPKILKASEAKDFEALAILMRQLFGGLSGPKPVLDLDHLLKEFGLIFQEKPIHLGTIALDDRKGQLRIGASIRPGLPFFESLFLKAHILGHFLIHLQPAIARGDGPMTGFIEKESPLIRYMGSGKKDRQENEADQFAAALLIPLGMGLKSKEILKDPKKAARLFQVPESFVSARWDSFHPTLAPQKTIPAPPVVKSDGPRPFSRLRSLAQKIDKTVSID